MVLSGESSRPRIDILTDHATRELVISAYISHVLEQVAEVECHHQDFLLTTEGFDFWRRTRRHADLVSTPSYNVGRSYYVMAGALRRGASLAINHSEQIFAPIFHSEKLNLLGRERFNRHIVGHMAWGEKFAALLIDKARVAPRRVYITGNPKLTYARRWMQLEKRHDEHRPTVLIVSDFKLADYQGQEWEKFRQVYKIPDRNRNAIYRQARSSCLQWVQMAATKFPRLHFLVRPHPGENTAPYKTLACLPNVEITGSDEFSWDAWRCDVAFIFTSTSIFELLALGKPVFNMGVAPVVSDMRAPHYDAFVWVDEEEFNEKLHSLNRDGYVEGSGNGVEVLHRYMYKPSGNALLRMAIAHLEIAKRTRDGERSRYDSKDHWRYFERLCSAGLRHGLYQAGLGLKRIGLDNGLARSVRRKEENYLKRGDLLTQEQWRRAQGEAQRILTAEEHAVIEQKAYSLRQTEHGVYIDLPFEVDGNELL